MTVATGELSEAESERTGLVSTHAYAVLDLKVLDEVCYVMIHFVSVVTAQAFSVQAFSLTRHF